MTEAMWTALIAASVPGMLAALGFAIVQTVKYIRASEEAKALYTQAKATVEAKNEELQAEREENERLWALLEGVTR